MSGAPRVELVGYTDRPSVGPGQLLRVMVSSAGDLTFEASLVRLGAGAADSGEWTGARPVAASFAGHYEGVERAIACGSYMRALDPDPRPAGTALSLCAWIWPTTPEGERQCVLAQRDADGNELALTLAEGRLALEVTGPGGETAEVRCETPVRAATWAFAAGWLDPETGRGGVFVRVRDELGSSGSGEADLGGATPGRAPISCLVAAREGGAGRVGEHYNGKVEAPAVFGHALTAAERERLAAGEPPTALPGLLAAWDFSFGIETSEVADCGGRGLDGTLAQLPTRAVTGHRFDGSEVDWRREPSAYGAVHFHDDDLDDAGWEPAFEWRLPVELPSGVYAIRLRREDGAGDELPFFVRPRRGKPGAEIAFLAPTFTYLAYGDEHQLDRDEIRAVFEGMGSSFTYPAQAHDRYILEHGLNSAYDRHRDGSGVSYSSWARPLLTIRPEYGFPYLCEGEGGPHGLPLDLDLLAWLEERGTQVDVITDHDLHAEGAELLAGYRAVISGSHHEYWSREMLDGLAGYQEQGGRFVYLSGNGLYWVTGLDAAGNSIEIRRCGASTRTWEARPGEWHLASTGELGGLWRFRDRAPNRFVGVGMTAEGLGAGRPYVRTAASEDPRAAFVFAGVGRDELIGDSECSVVGYGAAGYEIDRFDPDLGSPPHALVLATASGFSDGYQHVVDEVMHQDSKQGGPDSDLVRADLVFYETPAGGAVFAVGSIAWCGALRANQGDNSVARVTANVIDRFLDPEPFELPG